MLKMKIVLIAICMVFSQAIFAAPVNVNTATAEEIAEALSGIGIKKAQRIVDYREAYGDFKAVHELLIVDGIGPKTLKKNEGDIRLTDKL